MSDPCQCEHEASDVEIQCHDSQLRGNSEGIFAKLLSFFDIETTRGCRLYIAAYLFAVFVHPLHYYCYVIKPEQNCLEFGIGLYVTLYIVLVLNVCLGLFTPNFIRKHFAKDRSCRKMEYHFFFPQVSVLLMTPMVIIDVTGRNQERIFSITINLILFLYIVLLIGLSSTFKKAIENNSDCYLAKAKWGKAAINLFLYFLGGHVFGALWYIFAIGRVVACWREDYFSRNHFDPHSFFCRYKHKNIGELNCPQLKNVGTEMNEFGIFNLALQSRIVYLRRDFGKRLLYGFRWGLQALSCFGQNLIPSTFVLENIFVISIIIYSTVLFALFIGNVQKYLEFNGIDTIKKMKMEDCLRHLKEVEEFQNLGELALKDLCYHAKQVFYVEGTVIIQEGEPINEMLFLLHGELQTHNSRSTEYLKDGEIIGKELVTCLNNQPESSESTLPISPTTAQAFTNVEALALTAYDLKKIFIKYNQRQAN